MFCHFKVYIQCMKSREPHRYLFAPLGNVRLAGGIATSEGFAQISTNGEFGTICDDSDELDVNGWPSVFCQQLGFHHAGAVSKLFSEEYIVLTGPVFNVQQFRL